MQPQADLSSAEKIRQLVARRTDLGDLLRSQTMDFSPRTGLHDIPNEQLLDVYLEEARFFLNLVRPFFKPGIRVLEIGGGLGLFHVMACLEGIHIISVEPSGDGFSKFREFGMACVAELTGRAERFVDAEAEHLPWAEGTFDLVVSNNVLEHVTDPEKVMREAWRVIRPGGSLVVHCPNYLVPYEPHYKVPVIPCAVRLSGHLVWRAFRNDPVWRSVNSIHALQVMRIIRSFPRAGLEFQNVMPTLIDRISQDPQFVRRHRILSRFISMTLVRKWLTAFPPWLMTPMVFRVTKPTRPVL